MPAFPNGPAILLKTPPVSATDGDKITEQEIYIGKKNIMKTNQAKFYQREMMIYLGMFQG